MSTYLTMRVARMYDKKLLHIFLDSGSTHNFFDLEKKLGCKLESVAPLPITAGGGHKLTDPYVSKGFG